MRTVSRMTAVAALLLVAPMAWAGARLDVAADGTRHALVMGNQRYEGIPLSNPDRDARDVAAKLEALGFDVDLVQDASLKKLTRAVSDYLGKLHPGDTSFVFYAGHGVQVKGENYIIPVDFRATWESDVPFAAYPLDQLMDGLGEQSLDLNVIVLDACRDNPFKGTRSASRGLTMVEAGTGTLIAFATGPGQTAQDGDPDGNGVFTGAMLKYLDTPGLDVETLFRRVREEVAKRTDKAQVPWMSSNVLGRHVLKPLRTGEKAPEEPAAVVVAAVAPVEVVRPTAMPALPSSEGLGLDASADALVDYDAALSADKQGQGHPEEATKAWAALASVEDGNPYRSLAKERAKHWGEYVDRYQAFQERKAVDFEKLKRVFPLRSLSSRQKETLLANYLTSYGYEDAVKLVPLVGADALIETCREGGPLAQMTVHARVAAQAIWGSEFAGKAFLDGRAIGETPVDANGPACAVAGVSDTDTGEWKQATLLELAGGTELQFGHGMVYISGGTFLMGSNFQNDDEKPMTHVTLSPYYMDRMEVTVAAYTACVNTGKCSVPHRGGNCNWGDPSRNSDPINCVNWSQAKEFCEAQGERLPTEAEWEYGAGGKNGRNFPWGDAMPNSHLARWPASRTAPVGSYPAGASPFGLQDMAGNVCEWVEDAYAPYLGGSVTDPKQETGPTRVFRGCSGGRNVDAETLSVAGREKQDPTVWGDGLGFRCARGTVP